MNATIRLRLLQTNPWFLDAARFAEETARHRPERWVPRLADEDGLDDTHKAKLVVGPRQVGKSSWVWSRLTGCRPDEVLWLNCEEERVRAWLGSAGEVLSDLESEFPTVRLLFIEEAQHLTDAGLFIKGLIDARRGLDIWATGSSSFHLEARTRESLAGRATRRRLLPFSLGELMAAEPSRVPAARAAIAEQFLQRQWLYGSYPAVWFARDPVRELAELLEAFVVRDASDRFRIQHTDAFRRLIQLGAGQVGGLVNLAEWASLLGVAAGTVREYLSLLEEAFIVKRLPAFSGGKRSELTHATRLHFYDMGIRNAALNAFGADLTTRPDRGALAEGWVFGELAKSMGFGWNLYYWNAKGGAEMDFVLVNGARLVAIEVKVGVPRLTRSARSFIDAYSPERLLIVSSDTGRDLPERVGETVVEVVPFTELGIVVAALTGARGADAGVF